MNVVMIMAGGVGNRFGANIPKQYIKLNGKPIIDYVIENVQKAKSVDKILIVIDKNCVDYSDILKAEPNNFDFADNGSERYESIKNGFDFIKKNYDCEKVLIADAVAPFIYPELIDNYFSKLDDYDAVITSQKITGALGNYSYEPLDREAYYMTQSPEAFNFNLIYKNFNPDFKSQELAWQLPKDSKKYLNFNFKNNLKITYDFELEYASFLMKYSETLKSNAFLNIRDKNFFITNGINDYLLRVYPEETNKWLNELFLYYKELANRYGNFKEIIANQSSRYGSVMLIRDTEEKEFIIKVIPQFLNRYESERDSYKVLSSEFLCELLETDDVNNSIILKKLRNATPAVFEDNINLTNFFNRVFENARPYTKDLSNKSFTVFYEQLKEKFNNKDMARYLAEEVGNCLEKSINYFDKYFKNKDLYVIHGDLRKDNILKDDNKYFAIDPIGYISPIEFETSRFIINDIVDNILFDMDDRLELLLNYFSKWFIKENVLIATYIFTAFITYNSTFENSDMTQTRKYIKLMNLIESKIEG